MCNDLVSNTLSDENTADNLGARPRGGSGGASSPPHSGFFSNPGSGEIGTVPMTEEE